MNIQKVKEEDLRAFYKAILSLRDEAEAQAFFSDLCTVKEINQMAQRIKAAKLLMEGKTYSQVIAETDISSATLSRVSRCVQYGEGYVHTLGEADGQ